MTEEEPMAVADTGPEVMHKYLSKATFIPATMPGNQYTQPVENHNVFVPSMSGMENRSFLKLKDADKEFDVSWWRMNDDVVSSFFYYPHMLVSYWYGKDHADFRAKFGIPSKDKFSLCGDSGGFQVVTQHVNIDPLKALEWQQFNCNWGFTLDIPPLLQDAANTWTLTHGSHLVKCQEKTADNAKLQHEHWSDDSYEMVFVAHGYDWAQMLNARKVLKDRTGLDYDDFSGVSISCKYSDPLAVARGCFYALQNVPENKRFHYLALSGYNTTMILLYAFTYRRDIKLTMDSSSYGSQGNIRRVYWMDDMKNVLEFGANNTSQLKVLPCNCPVCSVVLNPEILRQPGSLPGGLISIHNLYVYVNFVEKLKAYSTSQSELRDYIVKAAPDIEQALDFIDMAMERGYDVAYDRFMRDIKKMKQSSSVTVGKL